MRRRLRKQLTIVGVVGGVLASVVGFGVVVSSERQPPPPLPPPVFDPLVVRDIRLLRDGRDRGDLFALVKNPNAGAGIRAVDYTFSVRAGDDMQKEFVGTTFFLPGQEKPLIQIHQSLPEGASDLRIRFGTPDWVPVDAEFRGPSFVPVSRESRTRSGQPDVSEIKGVLANESSLDYLRVEVTAVGRDADGDLVGVGRTFVGSLLAGERREYTLSWPLPAGRTVSLVQVFPEVNVFSPSAIQPRAGSSRLER